MFFFVFGGCFLLQLSPSVLWYCWLGLLTSKNRLPYNLYCVGGDVKHCSISFHQSQCHHCNTQHDWMTVTSASNTPSIPIWMDAQLSCCVAGSIKRWSDLRSCCSLTRQKMIFILEFIIVWSDNVTEHESKFKQSYCYAGIKAIPVTWSHHSFVAFNDGSLILKRISSDQLYSHIILYEMQEDSQNIESDCFCMLD